MTGDEKRGRNRCKNRTRKPAKVKTEKKTLRTR